MSDLTTTPAFAGFSDPHSNFTEMPLALIDALPLFTSLAELKVILYVLRHTWGYREYDEGKRISVDEFEKGRKRRDGTRIDAGVGMVKNSITSGIEKAVEDGFLTVEIDDHDKARIVKYYALRSLNPGGQQLNPEGQKLTPGIPEVDPRTEIETLDRDSKIDQDLSQPASQVTTPAPSLPSSRDDNRPKVVENAQADSALATLQEGSDQPPPVPAGSPAYTAPTGTRWIYPLEGDRCHLVRDANQPTVTLCGITPLPSYGGPGGKTQVQCAECLKATEKKPKNGRKPKADVPPPGEGVLDALCILCYGTVEAFGLNASTIRGSYNKIAACCAPVTVEELRGFYLWWTQTDWRGKRGDKPNPYLVASLWATFKSERNGVSNGHASQSNAENAAERQRRNTAELEHAVAWDDDGPTNSASAPRGLPPNNRSVA